MASSRREFLEVAGTAGLASVTGCATTDESSLPASVTPAPVPTDTPTAVETARRSSPAPSPESLQFTVEIVDQFTDDSPARLEITVKNTGDELLTALGGTEFVFPFIDNDYTGTDWSGDAELLLIPDHAVLRIDPEWAPPDGIEAFLPDTPTDGCWSVPFDWPGARSPNQPVLHSVSIYPGETRRHRYSLYYIDECAAGTFSFENTFDLVAGDPPIERGLYRARTAFDVAQSDSTGLLVRVHDPRINRPP